MITMITGKTKNGGSFGEAGRSGVDDEFDVCAPRLVWKPSKSLSFTARTNEP